MTTATSTPKKPISATLIELIVIVATSLGLALAVQAFIVKPYRIPSGSMLPTLHINQRVLVNRLGTHFFSPQVGDIVVFHPPSDYAAGCADRSAGAETGPRAKPCDVAQTQQSSETFIKRVVGLPGDRISIDNGHVIRDGVRETDA